MRIDFLSDLHGYLPETPGGDVLILCGDYTAADKLPQWATFFSWLKKQKYTKKILIAGNHDNYMMSGWPKNQKEAKELGEVQEWLEELDDEFEREDFEYLCDSGCEVVTNGNRVKIWGTPWTKTFPGINPRCCAFTVGTEEELAVKFSLIPEDTDILVSHGPPYRVLDANVEGHPCGSVSLLEALDNVKPLYMVFGHIHEQGGKQILYKHIGPNTWCLNVSHVDERYKPKNKVTRIYLPHGGKTYVKKDLPFIATAPHMDQCT